MMKLLLVTVFSLAVFSADGQVFRNEPGEAQLLPGGSEGQGEAEGGQILLGRPKMLISATELGENQTLTERSDTALEDHQMENLLGRPKMLISATELGENQTLTERTDTALEDHQMESGDMAMLLGRSKWCKRRDGRCRNPHKFPCDNDGYQESPKGRPYCTSKRRTCCYPANVNCEQKDKCKAVEGVCQKKNKECSGKIIENGCKNEKDCECCAPKPKCEAKDKCKAAEGVCQNKDKKCSGKIIENGCKDDKNCVCCIANCNEAEGFFKVPGCNQCFKYFNDSVRSWKASKTKCHDEGLMLAKPRDPVVLRKYLVKTFGDTEAWIGARGTGSSVNWIRDGTVIDSTSSLWYAETGTSGRQTSTKYCLLLLSFEREMNRRPDSPYYMYQCIGYWYALCELVM